MRVRKVEKTKLKTETEIETLSNTCFSKLSTEETVLCILYPAKTHYIISEKRHITIEGNPCVFLQPRESARVTPRSLARGGSKCRLWMPSFVLHQESGKVEGSKMARRWDVGVRSMCWIFFSHICVRIQKIILTL